MEVSVNQRRCRSLLTLAVLLALATAACTDEGGEVADPAGSTATSAPTVPTPVDSPGPTPSPTQPALPEEPPATRGQIDTDCVEGWVTPAEGSKRYLEPLGIIRRTTGVEGPLVVVDMRYFVGPESPPTDKGYLLLVQRWYVKLYAEDDLSFQGRFLVEARRFGRGLSAVAPYDTNGFRSPEWVGFQFESADPTERPYPGLPGDWTGIAYDFVDGAEGLQIPGLPAEVSGCLDAT